MSFVSVTRRWRSIARWIVARIRVRSISPKPALLPATAAWLANIRAEASAPRALVVVVKGPRGSAAIFPEDIVGKSDDDLLAFIASRLAEQ